MIQHIKKVDFNVNRINQTNIKEWWKTMFEDTETSPNLSPISTEFGLNFIKSPAEIYSKAANFSKRTISKIEEKQ